MWIKSKVASNILDSGYALEVGTICDRSAYNIKLNDIFDLLNIERYCCRRVLITNVNFDSLLYSSINN